MDNIRAQDEATIAAASNAGLPSRPEGVPSAPSMSDLHPMSNPASMSTLPPSDTMSHRGGGGRGRGRGGHRGGYRGSAGHTQGGYTDRDCSSSSYFALPRQQYGGVPASQDAIREEQYSYASTSQQHMGRGRGGFPFGQQPAGRRPYRGGGRGRSSWSRTRNYQPRPSFDHLPSQGILNRVAAMQVTESHSGWDTRAVEIEAATVPQQQVEDLSSPHAVVLPPTAVDPTSVESSHPPADATEQLSAETSESSEPETSLALVRVDRTPSLDSETTETTSPAQSEQREFIDFDDFVATTPTSVHPRNNAIQLQDIHFASVPNPIHPRPGQPPETICAWYSYPMPPREGVFIAPLPGLSPVSSGHPPPPPPPHPPVGHPPSHFYFTHDHAFLALCHPVPMLPYAWLPVPYLAYWGPERFGHHPNYYDVPMFASD